MSQLLEKLSSSKNICTLPISKKEWMELVCYMSRTGQRSAQGQADRRGDRRYVFNQAAIIGMELKERSSRYQGTLYLAKCRDISSEGLGLFHDESVREFTECNLQLFNKANNVVQNSGVVRYCQPYENGTYRLGIQLDNRLNLLDFI